MVRLLRFRQGRPDVAIYTNPAEVREPFQCVLTRGDSWIDFGAGNDFAAAQFAQYHRSTPADVALFLLAD